MDVLPPHLATLSPEEKLELIDLLMDSLANQAAGLTPAQKADLEKRIPEDRLNPDEGRDWEELKVELGREIA